MESKKHFLKEQFRKMSALRSAPTDEYAIKGIVEQWERLLNMVGEQRFAAGVSNCIRYMSFFPSVDELEQKVPAGENLKERCPRCRDLDGFEYCDVTSREGKVSRGVRRCGH